MKQKYKTSNLLLTFPIFLVFYELATYLSNDMYLSALPSFMSEFSVSHTTAQFSITVWFIGSSSLQLLVGPLSDRLGRKPILLAGGVTFVLASFVCGFTNNIFLMLAGRFLQGLTVCSVAVAGYACIHETFEHKQAIKLLARMNGITVLAPAFGPLLGSAFIYFYDWHSIFFVLAVWSLVAVVALFFVMPESNTQKHPIYFKRLARSYRSIVMNKLYMKYLVLFCLLFAVMIAWITAGPYILLTQYSYGTFTFSMIQGLIFGGFIVGTQITRGSMERYDIRLIIRTGMLITFLGALLSSLFFFAHNIAYFIAALFVFCLGSGIAFPGLHRLGIESCDEPMGIKMAVFSSMMNLFGVTSSVIIINFKNSPIPALSLMMSIVIISCLLIHHLTPTMKR